MPEEIVAGQIYSFQTRPYSEFGPPKTGRFATIKVLGVDDKVIAIAVLDGIWSTHPTLQEVGTASIINQHRFAYKGSAAVYGVPREFGKLESTLDDPRLLGVQSVSRAEHAFADNILSWSAGSRYAGLDVASGAAEGEWRWANDRDDLLREHEQLHAKIEAEHLAKEERYRSRLSGLTWDQLAAETPLSRWSSSPPFPPEEFTQAARNTIRNACDELRQLGPKPSRKDVRAILKQTVVWFNEADEAAGGVIETEEREDIRALLEEMAHVARQEALVDEIDEWREW